LNRTQKIRYLFLLTALLGAIFIVSIFLGRYPSAGFTPFSVLKNDPLARNLILNLRLPRLLAALLLGTSLGAAGQVLQMMFSNPLIEPGFLGVSQGSAFGAALAIIFLGNNLYLVQGTAIAFAVCGLLMSYFLAHRIRFGGWILRVVLAGIAVSAIFTAGVGFLKYLADPLSQLPEITFWLLGGLGNITWLRVGSILPVVVVSLFILIALRWRLNVLTLSDEMIHSLGVSVKRERIILLGAAVCTTAAVISICGIVGWVGLIVPHISRRLFGVDARYSLPGAMLCGGILTILCDNAARLALPGELPLGILTSIFGAVFFLILMSSKRKRFAA
jgi:iron complex transport system permease protein